MPCADIFLWLLLLVPHHQAYSVVPYTHVCQTFPFCYQQLSGRWVPQQPAPLKPTASSVSPSDLQTRKGSSKTDCWLPSTYCRPLPSSTLASVEADSATSCQDLCAAREDCLFFTFLRHRGVPTCSLLSSCSQGSRCTVGENCASGPPRCSCPRLQRTGEDPTVRYTRWTCGDLDPYTTDIPSDTTCTSTCPAWLGFRGQALALTSTCQADRKWSYTLPSNKRGRALETYATPDQPDSVCGCKVCGVRCKVRVDVRE